MNVLAPQIELLSYQFRGQADGPHLLLIGGVHGDEVCGPYALARLAHELTAGLLQLAAGKVTILPIANPAAYQQGKRFVQDNLNRIIGRYPQPQWPEQAYADTLARFIEDADYVLDLHAYHAGNIPYLFLDQNDAAHRAFAASLGMPYWITGWPELYSTAPKSGWSCDTIGYAQQQQKTGLLVECGHYQDPASIIIADAVARHALAHCQLITATAPMNGAAQRVRVTQIVWRDRDGDFVQPWVNLQACAKGEPIIAYADGSFWTAPEDGMIVLPNAKATLQHEWFYWAVPD
jgi:predicted deacylase